MRAVAILLAGAALGVLLTVAALQVSGGWYTYTTMPSLRDGACIDTIPSGAEIVPNQPNPCHFRRPRWLLVH